MMKRTGLLLAGLSALALGNTALATEPTALTDVQLDNVSAGYASVNSGWGVSTGGHYYVTGNAYGSFNLDDAWPNRSASVSQNLNTTSYGSGTTWTHVNTSAYVSN